MGFFIQFTGLSGAGKTTLAYGLKEALARSALVVEVIDGDEFRRTLCKDLGFSKSDRMESIRRLAAYAASLPADKIVVLAVINPYEAIRQETVRVYGAKTIWIKCTLPELMRRDTKGLCRRAMLPEHHPDKLFNLTGVNDVYEAPSSPDLIIETDRLSKEKSLDLLTKFTLNTLSSPMP